MSGFQGIYQGTAQAMGYYIDCVFCIDGTASMEDITGSQEKIINQVKRNAIHFYDDLKASMERKYQKLVQLRIRLILFRDYLADGIHAMEVTDFFELPQQTEQFATCVNSIRAGGGGDAPEDGLEALAYAMKSKWENRGAKRRQLIVVWTDTGTHELGYGKRSPHYPKGMPANLAELEDWWDEMDDYAKRLIIYAPDTKYWNYISENWDNVCLVPSAAGDGMSEHQYGEILDLLTNSI